MKVICMIPARMGSKRIPKKNIRILYDKPLVQWVIDAAKKANCFDEIYLNSEDDVFKTIAEENGIKFYKRSQWFSTDEATNDDFMYDFLQNVECREVVQLLATSPFITPEEIKAFTLTEARTLVSIKNIQIECVFDLHAKSNIGNTPYYNPINFYFNEKTQPSQSLVPVMAYAASLMKWNSYDFMCDYRDEVGAYHGAGNAEYFPLKGYSTVDIDTEEDWQLAEVVAEKIMTGKKSTPRYYGETNSESDIKEIVLKDGVKAVNMNLFNNAIFQLGEYIKHKNLLGQSWSTLLINTEQFCATAISQKKGEGNRRHYHKIPEFWYIAEGSYQFDIGNETIIAKKGSLVFVDKETEHQITSLEDGSVRLAVSKFNEPHIYV